MPVSYESRFSELLWHLLPTLTQFVPRFLVFIARYCVILGSLFILQCAFWLSLIPPRKLDPLSEARLIKDNGRFSEVRESPRRYHVADVLVIMPVVLVAQLLHEMT